MLAPSHIKKHKCRHPNKQQRAWSKEKHVKKDKQTDLIKSQNGAGKIYESYVSLHHFCFRCSFWSAWSRMSPRGEKWRRRKKKRVLKTRSDCKSKANKNLFFLLVCYTLLFLFDILHTQSNNVVCATLTVAKCIKVLQCTPLGAWCRFPHIPFAT